MQRDAVGSLSASRPWLAAAFGAGAQVIVILLVALIWRYSAGRWGAGAWVAYLVAFGVVAPIVGVIGARRVHPWVADAPQLAKTAAVIGISNSVFALSTLGFEEAGVPMVVYVSIYALILLGIFAGLARRWR